MSIVIALGVTTPETSYSDMAAGSDPESVEASPAVNEKAYSNHSCGSAQSHGYRGLPYADHNYGAPPPPTPPASPLSQTIIPRVELNGVARGPRYHPGHDQENSADSDSSSEEDGGVASWCHCSLTQDGFLIKCESCSFRGLDRRKGVEAQRRKPENVSVGESSATESGDEEVSPATVSYTATQHTPTSITLTVNRVKRNKSKKRKKSTEKARGAPKGKKVKAFREGSRKSMRMKNSTTEASQVDENTAEGWESKIRQWTDQYEEALVNQYSADVQTLLQLHPAANNSVTNATAGPEKESLAESPPGQVRASADMMDTINRTELACNNTVLGSQMQLQLGRMTRVQKHRKILRASKDLQPDTLVIEYRGKVMLKQQFEVNGHFFKKPYPFMLFYSKFNEVEMCVDARTFGNDARFVRRSCTPNAEVRHMIAEGMIHLCIYAVTQITKDAEVTIGFDYEFNSCNYKVDCACQKGNQNCPVQKHNLSPRENLLFPPAPSLPSSLAGAETRRRKARRKEIEGSVGLGAMSDDSNLPSEETGETQELRGGSDPEESLVDGGKQEAELDGELDESGQLISSRRTREERKAEAIMHVFENLDKKKRRVTPGGAPGGGGAEETKQEGSPAEEGAGHSSGGHPAPSSAGSGVSTRRTTYVSEPTVELDKTQASTSSSGAPSLPAPSKPPPPRSTKPRPKSRISRYRSSSSQRARRQRQALAQQQAAAEQGGVAAEEGPQGATGAEPGPGDAGATAGHTLDGDLSSSLNKGNLRYPKTKKYLVTEWLNDKVPDKASQEAPGVAERPLRITSDPTVLATTLNMLPGLSQPPLICTAPKHYVRFGSPFNPERHRPRPLKLDGTYGCYKKRWIQQAQDESCSASLEDGTESTSSHQSNSSSSTPNPLSTELAAPIKKRRAKYASEHSATPNEHLLPPLSPVTPPPPSEPLLSSSCAALLLGVRPRHHHYPGDEEDGGAACSPLPSLPTSRCNTPLQFENISSPEASPLHRPESISPEPCLRTDFDLGRPQFPDLSLSSSMESPVPLGPDDFSLLAGAGPPESQGPASVGEGSHTPTQATPPDTGLNREQAFRTEFNLIYTCSPLNANLGNPAADRRLSQSEGSFSPAESFYGAVGGPGLQVDAGLGSVSPYGEPNYGGGYPDSDTPLHASNPPQKKKRASLNIISLLTDKPHYQALAVRSEYKPVQNMVSLLEYRKRKQGSGRDSEPSGCGSGLGTPTRPGSLGSGRAESPGMISRPPHHHHHHSQHHHHPHLQPPTSSSSSPHSSFSSPAHPSSSIAQIEEVSPPPEHHHNSSQASGQQHQGNSHWMVPTSVERLREGHGALREGQGALREGHGVLREGHGVLREGHGVLREGHGAMREGHGVLREGLGVLREGHGVLREGHGVLREGHGVLREGHGVLERVLRGGLKMERSAKRPGGSDADRDLDADRYEIQTMGMASPMKSPHRYSPSVYTHQSSLSESHRQTDSPVLLQTSSASSLRGSYSPSAGPPPGQGFFSRLSSHLDPSQQPHNPLSYPNQTTSADSVPCGTSRTAGGALHQQSSSSSNVDVSSRYGGSHLKASLLSSGLSPTPGSRAHGLPKTDSGVAASVGVQATPASRLNQQQAPRSLKPGSPVQAGLQVGTRLLQATGSQHYPQRGPPLSQFQHPPIQGSGVRTQSGSF